MACDESRVRSLYQVRIALRTLSRTLQLTDLCSDAEIAGLMGQLERRAAVMESGDEYNCRPVATSMLGGGKDERAVPGVELDVYVHVKL